MQEPALEFNWYSRVCQCFSTFTFDLFKVVRMCKVDRIIFWLNTHHFLCGGTAINIIGMFICKRNAFGAVFYKRPKMHFTGSQRVFCPLTLCYISPYSHVLVGFAFFIQK